MINLDAGELAKNVLQGVQKAEKLGGLQGKASEKVVTILRDLIAQAQKLVNSSTGNHEALNSCIHKGKALLESKEISTEAVTKLTAELGALIKEKSGASKQPASGAPSSNTGDTPVRKAARPADSPEDASTASKRTAGRAADANPSPDAKTASVFSDVAPSAYYYDAVQWAVQHGIASGTTADTFGPDDACTRAQTVTLLWRAAGSPAPKNRNNPFTDIQKDAYYYDAVLWAVERGITSGITADTFNPDATVTRGQVATFLYRNAGSPSVKGGAAFTDVQSDAYYYDAVAWVAERGITSGAEGGAFRPDAICTRGQIVTFLYRSK